MDNELYAEIREEYLKEALPVRLVSVLILTAASVFAFLTDEPLFLTIGCLTAVIVLILICSLVTIMIACLKLSSCEGEVIEGTVISYRLVGWSANKTVWLNAVINDEYCSTWANAVHSKGTRVYLVRFNILSATHKIMVNADKADKR